MPPRCTCSSVDATTLLRLLMIPNGREGGFDKGAWQKGRAVDAVVPRFSATLERRGTASDSWAARCQGRQARGDAGVDDLLAGSQAILARSGFKPAASAPNP